MTIEYYLAYFSVVLIATVTPGPSMLLAIDHGANHGIGRSVYSSIGNVIGNLLIAFISLAGLRAILVASGTLFTVIKWVGALYLIYIGIRIFLNPAVQNAGPGKMRKRAADKKPGRLALDGFAVAIANPKGLVFFTALFPQFINPNDSSLWHFFILFATLGFIAFFGFMLYAVFGSRINRLFSLPSFKKIYDRVTGTIFACTGLAIAFSGE